MTGKQQHDDTPTAGLSSSRSVATMRMSPSARTRMRATEKTFFRYYNDMGKSRGNCIWGAGILAH